MHSTNNLINPFFMSIVTATMSFVMPSKYKRVEDLPVPMSSKIRFEEIPGYTAICIRLVQVLSCCVVRS